MCKSQVELDVAPIISYKMQAQEQWVNGVLSGVEYSAEKRRLQTGSFLESRSRPALCMGGRGHASGSGEGWTKAGVQGEGGAGWHAQERKDALTDKSPTFISACWTATTALTASQPSHSHLGRAVLKFPWERL